MPSRLRRILVPLAAGVGIALVLALVTLVVDETPLLGVNPDAQLWIAGVLAAVFGALAYAETEGLTGTGVVWGAVLGACGFLVAVGAGMAIFAATSSPYAAYAGWTVETDFEEEFDASTARRALEAQGFTIENFDTGRVHARNGSVSVDVATLRGHEAERSNATFRLSVDYDADGEDVDSAEEARRQARQDHPALEDRFQAFLDAFETKTGWSHVGEPEWQPKILVS